MNKTSLIVGGSFILGLITGFGIGYSVTKKSMEQHCDQAINDMRAEFKKELEDSKNDITEDNVNENREDGEEPEIVKIDKPSIMEMSSIINRSSDNPPVRTNYSVTDIKDAVKKVTEEVEEKTEKEEKKEHSVVSEEVYDIIESDYEEEYFNFDTKEDIWIEEDTEIQYDKDELPFDAEDVAWQNSKCFIVDKSNKKAYILKKV